MNRSTSNYETASDAQLQTWADEGDDQAGAILESRIRTLGPLESGEAAGRGSRVADALIGLLAAIEEQADRDSLRGRDLLRLPEYLRAKELFDD